MLFEAPTLTLKSALCITMLWWPCGGNKKKQPLCTVYTGHYHIAEVWKPILLVPLWFSLHQQKNLGSNSFYQFEAFVMLSNKSKFNCFCFQTCEYENDQVDKWKE
jgi:hypothetical protein